MEEELTCTGCGMDQEDWQGNSGRGYLLEGDRYCCQGCAEDTGCTCGNEPAPESGDGHEMHHHPSGGPKLWGEDE